MLRYFFSHKRKLYLILQHVGGGGGLRIYHVDFLLSNQLWGQVKIIFWITQVMFSARFTRIGAWQLRCHWAYILKCRLYLNPRVCTCVCVCVCVYVCVCVCVYVTQCCPHSSSRHIKRQVPSLVYLPTWFPARFQRLTRFGALQPAPDNSAILPFFSLHIPTLDLLSRTSLLCWHKTRLVYFKLWNDPEKADSPSRHLLLIKFSFFSVFFFFFLHQGGRPCSPRRQSHCRLLFPRGYVFAAEYNE